MNWRISKLDRYQLVSNSDAHSPSKLGREANLLDIDCSYVLENGDKVKIYGDGIMLESFPGQYPGVTKIQRTGRASLEETQEYEDQVTGMMKPVAVQ